MSTLAVLAVAETSVSFRVSDFQRAPTAHQILFSSFIHKKATSCLPNSSLVFGKVQHLQSGTVLQSRPSRKSSGTSRAPGVSCQASAEAMVEVYVKAAGGEPDRLGDCPFSQRVLLTLEEKQIPYKMHLIDTSNKQQWFLDVNPGGKVPVLKKNGEYIPDSDVITVLLEKEYPEPSLKVSEQNASVGGGVFGAFVKFLKSKDPEDGTEQALLKELTDLDNHLKASGPFVDGSRVTSVDLALIPKLYHLEVALRHFKKWEMPDLRALRTYIEAMKSREGFKKVSPPPEIVIRGWGKVLGV